MGEFFAKNVNLFWNIGKVGRGCFGVFWAALARWRIAVFFAIF